MKRAQVSIFIIVGILILLIVGGLTYFSQEKKETPLKITKQAIKQVTDAGSLQLFITECLKATALNGIESNFMTGGYNQLPLLSATQKQLPVPYFWYNGLDVSPTKVEYEHQLAAYIEENIPLCLDFTVFKDVTISEKSKPTVLAEIKDELITLSLNYELLLLTGATEEELRAFKADLEISIAKAIILVDMLITQQAQSPNTVQFTSLLNTAYENNFQVSPIFDKDTVFYYLKFNDVFVKGKPLEMSFAAKYDWQQYLQEPVDIAPIDVQFAEVGKSFTYTLSTTGEQLALSADTELFSILPDGTISFVPTQEETGAYIIPINAKNNNGQDTENLILIVKA